jgi:hypothetical protein
LLLPKYFLFGLGLAGVDEGDGGALEGADNEEDADEDEGNAELLAKVDGH